MRLPALALLAATLLPGTALAQAIAQPVVRPEVVVGHFALAQLMEKRCPTLRVDRAFVDRIAKRLGIADADVSVGGRYWGAIQDKNARFQQRLTELRASGRSEADLVAEDCRSALHVYGPKGNVMPGLMLPR